MALVNRGFNVEISRIMAAMCRMLAIVGSHPVPVQEAAEAFFPLGTHGRVKCTMKPGHLDGWGMSGFSAGRAVYFGRQAQPVTEAKRPFMDASEKAAKTQSPIVIAHLRKASEGARDISNTHPFHYKDWIFAHNGTVFGATASLPLHDAEPQGQTDSERLFLWIAENVRNDPDPTAALVALLKRHRETLVYSALNFLMSDGKHLWVYREVGDKRYDPGETAEERQKYYTLYFTRRERSAVVSSEPLQSLSPVWNPIGQRTLAVFSPEMLAPRTIAI
jgi:predicted glutamine amidotransferase